MRRWLSILLLAMLPLQFSWAAVASYCGHAGSSQGEAKGHHAHAAESGHVSVEGDAADHAVDHGCGHCHGASTGLVTSLHTVPAPAPAARPPATAEPACEARAGSRPERPQWQRPA